MAKHDYRFDMERLKESNRIFDLAKKTTKIKVLRSCLWFYEEQEITIADLEKYFTTNAIAIMETDKFIKIIENEK